MLLLLWLYLEDGCGESIGSVAFFGAVAIFILAPSFKSGHCSVQVICEMEVVGLDG